MMGLNIYIEKAIAIVLHSDTLKVALDRGNHGNCDK